MSFNTYCIDRFDIDAAISIASTDTQNQRAKLDRARFGGYLSAETVESFRAPLFGVSDAEAAQMDPHQRLALEISYDAFADAGYSKASLSGQRVGVFVASSAVFGDHDDNATKGMSVYDSTRSSFAVAAGRISFALGLQVGNMYQNNRHNYAAYTH
jgi:acyl transferase domain-containing protein